MEAAINYYERHLGDYAKDTAHLSMLEHGAYGLLLDRYYSTEQGIPADQAHRVARARTKEEREAVDTILNEFFTLTDGIWRNGRADEEVAKAQTKITAAQSNGKKGGRPKKNPTQTQEKPSGFPLGSENETQTKAHQTPDTRHQTPVNTHTESSPPPMVRAPSLAGQVCMAMKAAGIGDVNPGHLDLIRLIDAGATLDEFIGAASEARAKSKGFAYAVGTVKRRREEAAQAPAMHQGAMPQRPPTQAELNTLAAGVAMGLYKPDDFASPPETPTETIDAQAKRISA
jgi:uncharacterized protein YdaU (DUF1376 family)